MRLLKFNLIRKMICRSSSRIMILLSCVLLYSCSNGSNQNPVYELLKFRTEIKNHSASYSSEEWENAIDEYATICQELDKMQFTKEELLEIDKIKGEIAGYAATVATQKVSDEVKSIASEIESFAKGFSNTFKMPE